MLCFVLTHIILSSVTEHITHRMKHLAITWYLRSSIDKALGQFTIHSCIVKLVIRISRIVPDATFDPPLLSICIGHTIADGIEWNGKVESLQCTDIGVTEAGVASAICSTPWIILTVLVPTGIRPFQTWQHACFVRLILAACVHIAKARLRIGLRWNTHKEEAWEWEQYCMSWFFSHSYLRQKDVHSHFSDMHHGTVGNSMHHMSPLRWSTLQSGNTCFWHNQVNQEYPYNSQWRILRKSSFSHYLRRCTRCRLH